MNDNITQEEVRNLIHQSELRTKEKLLELRDAINDLQNHKQVNWEAYPNWMRPYKKVRR